MGQPVDSSAGVHPFHGTNVWDLLQTRARVSGDRPFLEWHPFVGDGARTWTYAELAADAASVAAGLTRRGVRRGDRVLIHLENCPEFLLSWFACAAVGAVAVTTNTRSAADELRYFADDCGAVGAITQPRFAALVADCAPALSWLAVIDHDGGEPASEVSADLRFEGLRGDAAGLEPAPIDPMAPMSVQYTSGTTSRPKGVLWTHANALWGARVNAVHEDLHPSDCHLTYMPLFHTNALAYSMLATLYVGARMVLVPKWSTSRFHDIAREHGCTWLSMIGPAMRAVATDGLPPGHQFRLFGAGVGDLPWDRALGVKTIGWWGMTETISQGIVGDPYTPNRPRAIGRPAPEYGISIVRDDRITPVEPEETGHLLVRGRRGVSMFAEYLNQPEVTAASFDADGWFTTGDRVTLHADGYISFADRDKDMLKVGGENVAASEIERVVLTVPGVVEAAVVARADDRLDEVPVVFVVGRGDGLSDAVLEACRDRLADFKVPRDAHVVRDLPRSTLSKINKAVLRQALADGVDLDAASMAWASEAVSDPSGDAD